MMKILSFLAAALLVAMISTYATAATIELKDYGGLVLSLPNDEWPDIDPDMVGETNGVVGVINILYDKEDSNGAHENLAYVGIAASPDREDKLGDMDSWFENYQLVQFLDWYRRGYDITEISRERSDTIVSGMVAKRVNLVISSKFGRSNIAALYFKDPSGKFRYAVFVFNPGGREGDVSPVVDLVKSDISWPAKTTSQ